MLSVKNLSSKIILLLLVISSLTATSALFVPTKRDTALPPDEVTYTITEPTDLELLYETNHFKYFFRDSRDTIAIYDKRNGYTWKTGTDLPFNKDIQNDCDDEIDAYTEQFLGIDPSFFGDFSYQNSYDANSITVDSGVVKVKIAELYDSDLENAISFSANNLDLTQGVHYKLLFDAYASDERKMKVSLGSDLSETITLSTQTVNYEFDFTLSTISSADYHLDYLLGNVENDISTISIFIDNIRVVEVDGSGNEIANTDKISRGDFELLDNELTVKTDDVLDVCEPLEARLNTTYTGFANSLITIEYFDDSNNIKRLSSASFSGATSDLFKVSTEDNHFLLNVDFSKKDISLKVNIYFDDSGIRYVIKDEDITGTDTNRLAAIIISPFLGSSGGAKNYFDVNEMDYSDDETFNYKIPGYTLIPDGSGSLIRFEDNDVKLQPYTGQIYGTDVNLDRLHYNFNEGYIPFKEPSIPVFGIAHGDRQAAFVAYARKGEEYMQIISMPEDNLTYYNFSYPRFEYNKQYLQVYNKSGWGYLSLYENRNHYDIDMRYDFLSGDGSTGPSADYVGMAKQYRNYLMDNNFLHELDSNYDHIPLHVDFLMSDVEEGVTGYKNMVTTNVDGVSRILADLRARGITNINASMLGWNDGGITLGDPRNTNFSKEIGTKRDFMKLIDTTKQEGIDLSFQDDYYWINEQMMSLRRNASKHYNTWYSSIDTFQDPIETFYYARPIRSVEWMKNQADVFSDMGVQSYTVSGITDHLISDFTDDTTRTMSKQIITDGFDTLATKNKVNASNPNSYLWPFIYRYLNTPVYGTQYLIETDTVPFLQLVLQGTMELYGPYSNFSFYTDEDVLRMIDYNVYPSFVLTDQPAYLLTDTNSKNFYSTEYDLYEELIYKIYHKVDTALSPVIGFQWIDRQVIENGIIVNTYESNIKVVINYTQDSYNYEGIMIQPVSFEVVGD
jgi:hypothetical protein